MLIEGKIDPVAADAQWARNTRVRVGSRPTDDANLQLPGSAPDRRSDDGGDYWASKAKREAAEAQMAELKLAEMCGELVRADAIRSALSKNAAAMREALLQMPSRVVPLLVADPSAAAMDRILRDEVIRALRLLTEGDDDHGRA